MRRGPTVDAKPLQRLLRQRIAQYQPNHSNPHKIWHNLPEGIEGLARRMGLSGRTLLRWLDAEELSIWQADNAAIRLGLHPVLIWGLEFYNGSRSRNGH